MAKKWPGGDPPTECDICGRKLKKVFIDGKTTLGPWANMCKDCHEEYGVGLGTGKGQLYTLDDFEDNPRKRYWSRSLRDDLEDTLAAYESDHPTFKFIDFYMEDPVLTFEYERHNVLFKMYVPIKELQKFPSSIDDRIETLISWMQNYGERQPSSRVQQRRRSRRRLQRRGWSTKY